VAGLGVKASPPETAATGSRIRPPRANPKPVAVRSSRPATGRAPISVSVANPAAARTARPALASTALSGIPSAGKPTSRLRPVSARLVAQPASRAIRRWPRARSTASTMTGALPIVTRVATLTELSDTAVK
jgi:hypothetical protein